MAIPPPNFPRRLDMTVSDTDTDPIPPSSSNTRPWLFVVYGNDRSRHIELQQAPLTLGRGTEAGIILNDHKVSKIHCTVRVTDEGVVEVVDNQSRNGTFVDGQRVEKATLGPTSDLRIGDTVMRVEHKDPARVKFEEEMFKAAVTDPLTGIPNRRQFTERAQSEIARAQRHSLSAAAVFVDVDHFKGINDTHGHAAGDAVLKEIAQRINATRRAEDLLCRYGGEEFVLLLASADLEKAAVFCERLRAAIEAGPIQTDGKTIPVTASLGVSAFKPGDTVQALLQRADAALYRAKEKGRNRVERDA